VILHKNAGYDREVVLRLYSAARKKEGKKKEKEVLEKSAITNKMTGGEQVRKDSHAGAPLSGGREGG